MIKATEGVSKIEQSHAANLVTFGSSKSFDDVVKDFEEQLGRFDQEKALSSTADLPHTVKRMQGTSGLMIIAVLEMDHLLPELLSSGKRARQYLVGNPLIAGSMAQYNILAALYAPPRVLVYTGQDQTYISYDQPSTLFGPLAANDILPIAEDLDRKFDALVRKALA